MLTTFTEQPTAEWVPIITAISALIVAAVGSFGALLFQWVKFRELKEAGKEADQKLDEIHVLTNSNLTDAKNRIGALEASIRKLIDERDLGIPADPSAVVAAEKALAGVGPENVEGTEEKPVVAAKPTD